MDPHYRNIVVWFRRDLRLHDNPALHHALAHAHEVVPVFVFTDAILQRADISPARVQFLCESLTNLADNLRACGSSLVLRHGDPVTEIPLLMQEIGAEAVYFHEEVEPYGIARDRKVREAVQSLGKKAQSFPGLLIVTPERLRTSAGNPYTVYTPYAKAWRNTPVEPPFPRPDRISTPQTAGISLPTPVQLGLSSGPKTIPGGETEGLRLRETFFASAVSEYGTQRDLPAEAGTSRLSAHFHFGTVSPRETIWELIRLRTAKDENTRKSVDTFIGELAWRDFYLQILAHFPKVETESFRTEFKELLWQDKESHWDAWKNGLTGYPIVDAGMRQLRAEGWMHNRVRMIVASFLTKDLLINWQEGERFFMQNLVDGDLAANNGGWQWAASTGTDAQPFFRIFNPARQSERFDPLGAYIKYYIPELKRLPAKFVHDPAGLRPHELEACGVRLGKDYPQPIVEHSVQREKALALYRSARKS